MSTTAYYNFISKRSTPDVEHPHQHQHQQNDSSIDSRRQSTISPASLITTSSSTSSSSLNQFNSLSNNSSSNSSSIVQPQQSNNSGMIADHNTASLNNRIGYRRHSSAIRQTSVTPIQQHSRSPSQKLFHSHTLQSLEPKPFKPFKSNSEYLEAMKEDLAEWLNKLYSDLELNVDNFFASLETGSIICRHANNVSQMGRNFQQQQQETSIYSSDSGLIDELVNAVGRSTNHSSSMSSTSSNSSLSRHDYATHNNNGCLQTTKFSSPSPNCKNNTCINWQNIKMIPFKQDAKAGTFFARDNICQFIQWCRSLNIIDCLLFETDDLVVRKNEKSFILCLLEVARIGFKVGMPTPLIIQFEQDIDREIENDAKLEKQLEEEAKSKKRNQDNTIDSYDIVTTDDDDGISDDTDQENMLINGKQELDKKELVSYEDDSKPQEMKAKEEEEEDTGPKPQVITNDLVSLHERVVQLLCQCTCPTQFLMVRVGDNGKYKVGDKLIIFVRILRRHIMVRVGGGWQELSEFLRVKDPCRSKQHIHSSHQSNSLMSSSHYNHHQGTQVQAKIAPNSYHDYNNHESLIPLSASMSRSRLNESDHHMNTKRQGSSTQRGQRLISSSVSMSWLSHNS